MVHFAERAIPLAIPVVGVATASTSILGLTVATQTLGSALFVTAFVSEFFFLVVSINRLLDQINKHKEASPEFRKEVLFVPFLKTITHACSLFTVIGGMAYAVATGQTMLSLMSTVMPVFLAIKALALCIELVKNWKDYASGARVKLRNPLSKKLNQKAGLHAVKTLLMLSLVGVIVGVSMMQSCSTVLAVSASILCVTALVNLCLRQVAFHPKNKEKLRSLFSCSRRNRGLQRKKTSTLRLTDMSEC